MRGYEVVYILKPELDEEAVKTTTEQFSNLVTTNGGEILGIDHWGKRKLAFEIKDCFEGIYVIMRLRSNNEGLKELDRTLKISDQVLKNLIVKLN